MHQVLQIQELLAIIFNYIRSPASLAAVARTCQAWSDLVLDTLWGTYGKVDHLVRFIPKRLQKKTGFRNVFDKFSLTRDVKPSDWDRFKKYHHRIRNVMVVWPGTRLDIWPRLSTNVPSDMILFPCIQSMSCTCDNAKEVMLLQLFLRPSLRHFGVTARMSDELQVPLIQSMCANVLQRCPDLRSFDFSLLPRDRIPFPEVLNIMGDFICQYHALEYLIVPRVPLTTDAIRHIIRLPRLRGLTWSPESSSYPTDEDEFGFPSLVHYFHLETQSPALDSINSFLSTMALFHPNTKIHTLRVTLPNATTETQMQKGLSLIANRCDQSTLTTLHFYKPDSIVMFPPLIFDHDHRIKLHFDTLRPLLKFRNIQRLVLTCEAEQYGTSCVFDDIDDDALQDMSSAWPHLTHFGLDVAGFRITLDGFLAFLKGSPNLEHLQLTADFHRSSLNCIELDELPRCPKMKTLHVKDSILKDACKTSVLFLVLFPALERVQCNPVSEYFDGWKRVNRLMWRWWKENDPNSDRFL